MRTDDLMARVHMSLGGLDLSSGVLARVHRDLLRIASSRKFMKHPTRPTSTRRQLTLIGHINQESRGLKRVLQTCFNELEKLDCAFEVEVSHDGNVSDPPSLDSIPSVTAARLALQWSIEIESLSAEQQGLINELLAVEIDLALEAIWSANTDDDSVDEDSVSAELLPSSEMVSVVPWANHNAKMPDPLKLRQVATDDYLSNDLDDPSDSSCSGQMPLELERRLDFIMAQLGPDALHWKREAGAVPLSFSGFWLPVDVPLKSQRQVLHRYAFWHCEFGSRLTRPMPLDMSASHKIRARWNNLWRVIEECGDAYILLGVWLRCINGPEKSKVCDLCYRHVSEQFGLRTMCSKHERTLNQNAHAKERHLAATYKRLCQAFFARKSGLKSAVMRVARDRFSEGDAPLLPTHRSIPNELIRPAARLAATLQLLLPLVTRDGQEVLRRHLAGMVDMACRPFEQSAAYNKFENVILRRQAVVWLSWSNFLRTWFGKILKSELYVYEAHISQGHDPHHPLIREGAWEPSEVVHDLLRQQLWWRTECRFDEAYVQADLVKCLRDIGELSFAEIGVLMGISGEAVRKFYHRKESEGDEPRKWRIVPDLLHMLESSLEAELLGT